jgi:hypothetical protein
MIIIHVTFVNVVCFIGMKGNQRFISLSTSVQCWTGQQQISLFERKSRDITRFLWNYNCLRFSMEYCIYFSICLGRLDSFCLIYFTYEVVLAQKTLWRFICFRGNSSPGELRFFFINSWNDLNYCSLDDF